MKMKSALALSCVLLWAIDSTASTVISSDLEGSHHWTTAGSPYIVDTGLNVEREATLTIDAGVVVKFNSGRSLTLDAPYKTPGETGYEPGGIINCNGTSGNPVVFTSYRDDSHGGDSNGDGASVGEPGDWGSVVIENGLNSIQHCLFRYARNGAVSFDDCAASLRDCTIEHCDSEGIYARDVPSGIISNCVIRGTVGTSYEEAGIATMDSSLTIVDCEILNGENHGIYMEQNGDGGNGSSVDIIDCEIAGNAGYPLAFEGSTIETITGNTLSGNGMDAFAIDGTFNRDVILKNIQGLDWPYVCTASLGVSAGVNMTVPAGTVIKADSSSITIEGILNCNGTSGNPVVFTSYRDDSHGGDSNGDGASVGEPGDWGSVVIENGLNNLQHCLFRYAVDGISISSCSPTIRDCVIEYCSGHGIDANQMTGGSISANTIRDCGDSSSDYALYLYKSSPSVVGNVLFGCQNGVRIRYSESNPTFTYNDFVGNTVGIENESGNLVDAENNWWGSTTGPSGQGPGSGDSVSINVDYGPPWLGMPNNRYYSGEASIVGHVYRDTNTNGRYDSGEGIAGATVRTLNGFTSENVSTADGSFEFTDIPGDAGYIVMAEALGYSAGVRDGVWVNALNATAVDIPLRQIDISTLSVEQISPNPNDCDHNGTEDAMTLMKGGTGYRYYRVVNSQGEGVSACGYTVKRADGVVITNGVTLNYQGLPGVMQIGIPESTLSVSGPSGDVSCIVTHLNGVELPSYKKKSFLVQVRPREYDTEWKTHLSGSASGFLIAGLKGEVATDYVINLEESNGDTVRPEVIAFTRGAAVGIGGKVEKRLGVAAGVDLGPIGSDVDVGAGVSGEAILGAQFGDEHSTGYVSSDLDESMAKAYLLSYPALSTASSAGGLMPFVVALENLVILPPYKTDNHCGVYFKGEGKVWAGAMGDVGTPIGDCKVGIGGSLGGKFRADALVAVRPPEDELAVLLGLEGSVSAEVLVGVVTDPGDKPFLVAGLSHGGKLAAGSFEYEVVWDSSTGLIKCGKITTYFDLGILPSDTLVKRTWIVTGSHSDLHTIFLRLPIFSSALVAKGVLSGPGIVFQGDSIINEFEMLAAEVADSRGRVQVQIQDRLIQLNEHLSPTFGVSGSVFGAGGSVSVGAEFSDSKTQVQQQSVLLGEREFALSEYADDQFTPRPPMSLIDIYADTWAEIGWEGLLLYATETAQAGVQTVVDTSVSVGQGVLTLAADSVAAGTEVLNNAWAGFWSALPPPQTMGASTYGTLGLAQATAEDGGETNNWRFGIGGFYDLQPAGTVLSSPGTLVISYADSEVEGIPEDTLAMYLWNTNSLRWDYQGGTVDLAGNSVSNQITVLGLYTLAPRMPYDFAELTPVPGAIPNDGASTVVFTSGVISNDDNTVISDGQLFSVSASGGTITTPDADGTVTGLQVTAISGQISFTVQSSLAATSLTVNASSVIGEAFADGQVAFVNAGAPAAPQNVSAVVDGTAIRVSWQSITNSDVVGYSVLYDDDNGAEPFEGKAGVIGDDSPIDVGNVSVYRLYGLETNATYYVGIKATDAFGLESPLSAVVSVLNTCPPDSDADGLPDSWENQFATPTVPSVVGVSVAHFDSLQDNDTDGMNNYSEYIAGTDPTDASSLFGVADATVVQDPRGFAVEWDGVNGRTYQVYVTTNLVGSWTAYGGPLTGSNGTMRLTVPMTNAVPQFIRLNVQKD